MPETKTEAGANGADATEAFRQMTEAQAALSERVAGICTEWAEFVAHRMQTNIKTQQDLLACQGLEEMQALQAAYFAQTREDYAREMQKLVTRAQELMAPVTARR